MRYTIALNRTINWNLKASPVGEAFLISLAAAAAVVAATTVVATAAATAVVNAAVVATTAEQNQQNDDPAPVTATETIITHTSTSKEDI